MALLESVTAFSWALLSYRKSAVISITYTDQNLQGIFYKWEIPFLYPDQIDSDNSTHSEDTGRHKEKQKKPEDQAHVFNGARERNRTSTGLPPHEPESCASTNSATRALKTGEMKQLEWKIATTILQIRPSIDLPLSVFSAILARRLFAFITLYLL